MAGEVDVNAMDANVDLSLQAAVKDSPSFRASVAMLEDDIDTLERWVDQLCKAIRLYIEDLSKVNDESVALAKKSVPSLGEGFLDPDMPMQALHIFADSLQATHAFNAKLVSDLEGNLLQPLTNLLRDDFRELKEARRANEKGQDKYESGLARYAASHKAKEASALREDAFQLYEVRKAYVRTSLDYTVKILKFRESFEHLLVEQFLAMIFAQLEHHESSYQVYKSVKTHVQQLQYKLSESRATYDYKLGKLQKLKKSLEDEAIHSARPNTLLQAYFPSAGQSPYYNPNISITFPSIDDNKPEKEGYLFERSASKTPLAPDTWSRRWFWFRGGKFGYLTTSSTGKLRGHVASCTPLQVLLCEARPRMSEVGDRRFCFEVVSSRRSFVLQAESEEEMNEWLTVFAKSKQKEMASASSEVIASMAYNSLPVAPSPPASAAKRASPTSSTNISNLTPSPPSRSNAQSETLPAQPTNAQHEYSNPTPAATAAAPLKSPTSWSAPPSSASFSEGLRLSDFGDSDTCHLVVADDPSSARVPESPAPALSSTVATDSTAGTVALADSGGLPARAALTTGHGTCKDLSRRTNSTVGEKFISLLSGGAPAASTHVATPGVNSGQMTVLAGAALQSSGGVTIVGPGMTEAKAIDPDSADIPQWKRYALECEFPSNLIKRNEEVHSLLKSLSNNDCALEVFHCSLEGQRACIRGRAYVTQSNICFYSSVLSLVTSFIVPFTQINKISLERQRLYSCIRITEHATGSLFEALDANLSGERPLDNAGQTSTAQAPRTIVLKLFTVRDRKHFHIVYLAWKNSVAQVEDKKPVPQLYKYLMEEGRRVDSPSRQRLDGEVDIDEDEVDEFEGESHEELEEDDEDAAASSRAFTAASAFSGPAVAMRRMQSRARFSDEESKNFADESSAFGSKIRREGVSSNSGGVPKGSFGADEPPPYIALPPTPISCGCADHLEEKKLDIVLPVPAVRLWNLMFGDSAYEPNGIWTRVYKKSNNTIQSATTWTAAQAAEAAAAGITDAPADVQKRNAVFTLQVNNPMAKVKETACFETLFCCKKDEYRCYTVVTTSKAPALPYSDAFTPHIRYCLTHEGTGTSRLMAHIGIKWHKNPMVKGIIRSAAMKGMCETIANLAPALQDDIQKSAALVTQNHVRTTKSESALKRPKNGGAIRRGKSAVASTPDAPKADALTEVSVPAGAPATRSRGLNVGGGWRDRRNVVIAILSCLLSWAMLRTARPGNGSFTVSWRGGDGCLVPDNLADVEAELLQRVLELQPARFQDASAEGLAANHDRDPPPALPGCAPYAANQRGNSQVVWRAVYLKDLEGIMNRSALDAVGSQRSSPAFDRFLRSRAALRPSPSSENRQGAVPEETPYESSSGATVSPAPSPSAGVDDAREDGHRWFLHQHYQVGQYLGRRRERIAVMRHDIIAALHKLNSVDQRLVLAEYVNWVADETFRCETMVKIGRGDIEFDPPIAALAGEQQRYDKADCASLRSVLQSLTSEAT